MTRRLLGPLYLTAMGLALFLLLVPRPAAAISGSELYFVSVTLNGVQRDGVILALIDGDRVGLQPEDMAALGLVVPEGLGVLHRDRRFLPLARVPGLEHRLDRGRLELTIECTAACFSPQILNGHRPSPPPSPTPLGLWLTYDLLGEKRGVGDFFGGTGEAAVFSKHGVGSVSFVARDLTGMRELIRQDTHWTTDFPNSRRRLLIGDGITFPSTWGGAVRFGGLQFGTDFGLQPGFVSFPTPSLAGEASLPSTIDIYVNDVRRRSISAEPGAFSIREPPVITGSGELRAVVRDMLGRETVIVQSFYASPRLLSAGLREYSIDVGWLRKGFGTPSDRYREPMVAGSYRAGHNPNLTWGIHLEASSDYAGIGPQADWKMPMGGILSGSAAASSRANRVGGLFRLGLEWKSERLGVYLMNEATTRDFSRLGAPGGQLETRMSSSGGVGLNLGSRGSISVNGTRLDRRGRQDVELASASYSRQLRGGTFFVRVQRTFIDEPDTRVFLSYMVRLGRRTNVSSGLERRSDQWTTTLRASRSTPVEGGIGFRAEAGDDGQRLDLSYDSRKGIAEVQVSHRNGVDAARFGLKGGLVLMAGGLYRSNPIRSAFALAEIGDVQGVRVLRDNHRVATTGSSGRALITGLRPYEQNKIALDPLDLPLSVAVGKAETTVVPRRLSGVIARISATPSHAAQIRIVDIQGQPLPPGTSLRADDSDETFPMGFEGAAYITGLERPRAFYAETTRGVCRVLVPAVGPKPQPKRVEAIRCLPEG